MNPDQIRRYVEAAFRAHREKLHTFVRKRLNAQREHTDDVLSITFERMLKIMVGAVEKKEEDNFLLMTAQREMPDSARTANVLRMVAEFAIKDVFRKVSKEPSKPYPWPDPDGDEIVIPKPEENLPDGLTYPEASETYRRILEELFRQTTRAFEKAVLIGMAYDIDDDEIAARFGRQRIHVQRARHLLRKRAKEIAKTMLED